MFSPYVTSLIRTFASYLVGALLSVPVAAGVEHSAGVSDAQARAWLLAGAVFVLGTLYYAIVRKVEHRWPQAGVLLGIPTRPVYLPPTGAKPGQTADEIGEKTGVPVIDTDPALMPAPVVYDQPWA